jgi:hypothetical protein
MTPAGWPAGAPASSARSNLIVTGGTCAFLGARGQAGQAGPWTPRIASVIEDPANRRVNGGGVVSIVLQVLPVERGLTRPPRTNELFPVDGQTGYCAGPEVGLEEAWCGRMPSQSRFPLSPFRDIVAGLLLPDVVARWITSVWPTIQSERTGRRERSLSAFHFDS